MDHLKLEEEFDNPGLGCALELFSEHEEILNMTLNLKNIYQDQREFENAHERFTHILSQYQEQPHLIDPHLDKLIQSLLDYILGDAISMELKHAAFKYLYFIINVRGFKVVLRNLPHEVAIVDIVLKMLENQDPNDKETWQTRYVLLIWMSIIVIIPFPLCRLDSFDPKIEVDKISTMQRILNQIKLYIPSGNMTRVAAFLTGRFINRTDVKQLHMKSFLDWCCELIMKDHIIDPRKIGGLACIASILKHGKRIDLLPYANDLLTQILRSNYRNDINVLARKYGIKVIQRIGLTFLKPRIAKWRYNRGCRSLMANLDQTADQCGDSNIIKNSSVGDSSELALDEDEPYDIPNEIEDVIEELLQGLRNTDTTIRWSAAKGIGRITGRLPLELADEVVGSVLELFSFMEADSAWHGGCLALAELGRRGLLLPSRLSEVVKLVLKALVYDEPRGYTSTGRHIRDAACYVCWSFARAYSVETIRPHVQEIAAGLLITAVFDREIHCRRAASAAFQENVGRQGSYPHGIDIVTAADYFAVSVRSNAYLNISHFIAGFPEYTQKLIDHLEERKIDHWDCSIRELAAQALGKLTSRAPEYLATQVIPKLLLRTKATEINARHGSVYAIGHIVLALSQEGSLEKYFSTEVLDQIRMIVPIFKERQQFRGIGGELLKQACSVYIECCSNAALPIPDESIVEQWLTLLAECLTQEVPVIRNLASKALPALVLQYLSGPSKESRRRDLIIEYTKKLTSTTQVVRMGFAQAIGSLPSFMMAECLDTILPPLIESTKITEVTLKWAESRREATRALASIIENVGCKEKQPSCLPFVEELFKTFLQGLQEYTLDARGDIGAWVREASMSGLSSLTSQLNLEARDLLTEKRMKLIVGGLAQQAVEKIDRTRSHAGKTFAQIIHSEPSIMTIPHLDKLLEIFPKTRPEHEVQWLVEAETFPRFVQMISMPEYTYNLILGFVLSVGGLSETLVKHSSSSLFAFIKSIQSDEVELSSIANTIIQIFNNYQFNSRVTLPLLVFLDRLLGSGTFEPLLENETSTFPNDLLNAVRKELSKCSDIPKHLAAEDVLCQLIQAKSQVCTNSLTTLCRFLGHRFIYIRKSTANKLYEALMLYGEEANFVESHRLDQAMTLLLETSWDQDLQILIPIRKEICDLLGVPEPKLRTPASQLTTS